jgi:hypothetical protein
VSGREDGVDDGNDPHVHVDVTVIHGAAAARNILASTFGLVGNLPTAVTTGCGLRVPYAMTSPRPESVTCLACRQYARDHCLRLADQAVRLADIPGSQVSPDHAARAAARYRDLATRFSGQA